MDAGLLQNNTCPEAVTMRKVPYEKCAQISLN